jgi:diguanylate cyclase (GGDEF)-like protein/PAS domain S-box-containing protein
VHLFQRQGSPAPARDPLYEAWLERNAYATALLYSGLIAVLLPAFHYVLQPIDGVPPDSLLLRLLSAACSLAVGGTLLLVPRLRRHAQTLQFAQLVIALAVIDVLIVNSRDHYLYIASGLLVLIGAQNAFYRSSSIAIALGLGFAIMVAYSAYAGILLTKYNITTLAVFAAGYVLAFIPASLRVQIQQREIHSRLEALRVTKQLEEVHAITRLGNWTHNLRTGESECSKELLRIMGLPPDTLHSALTELYLNSIHGDDRAAVEAAIAHSEQRGEPITIDHRIVQPDGTIRWVQLRGKQESDERGLPVRRMGTVMDITARKEAEANLERMARFDGLTGLANRAILHEALVEALKEAERHGELCAVLFLDLDRFKDINDSLGHSVGDLLLKEVAQRLRLLLPHGTLLARWGGDEFVALVKSVRDARTVEATCRHVILGMAAPFIVENYEFAVAASIGVALYPQDGAAAEVLIRNADTAMYAAKEQPELRYAMFAPKMHATATLRHRLQNELQRALATKSFSLYYQPILEPAANRIVSAEALLRWIDSEGTVHLPAEFISIAEDTGAIVPIGMWVIEQAARQVMKWQLDGAPLVVSVNISPRQLMHPDFIDMLTLVLRESSVNPALLEFEITESGLLPNESVLNVLERVKRMGVRIAVDDFGTGYSAFSHLKRLPLHTLKIDRIFVEGIERDLDRSIAESIIAVAHKLDLSVTAEGIETEYQRDVFARLGCDRLQGFHICEPLPEAQFKAFVEQFNALQPDGDSKTRLSSA